MSLPSSDYVLNNGQRYTITLTDYHKENSYVIYQASVFDAAFALPYKLYFRYSALRKLHKQMEKMDKKGQLPEFPTTKSIGFWNRTNKDAARIMDRMRELEYYLTKLLNNGEISEAKQVQYILKSLKRSKKRPRSCSLPVRPGGFEAKAKVVECPELFKWSPDATELL